VKSVDSKRTNTECVREQIYEHKICTGIQTIKVLLIRLALSGHQINSCLVYPQAEVLSWFSISLNMMLYWLII